MNEEALRVTYRLRTGSEGAVQRARTLALEQSIELPIEAVADARVLREVVACVESVAPQPDGSALARLELSAQSIGGHAVQLLNMLFGNSSLHSDVEVAAVQLPPAMAASFGGPALGIEGIRNLARAPRRALTCTALKPIGSTVADLARMTGVFADAGIDVIKDDHGWSARASASFEQRVTACQREVERANRGRSGQTLYAPALSGPFEAQRRQVHVARDHGVQAMLVTPMIAGVANFHALRHEFREIAFLAHPALAGNQMAPEALLGTLFRVFGADAVIFPNHGGRFSYSRATCQRIANCLREPRPGLRPALPVPAGGMAVERVPEIVADYGVDSMLLVGGSLLLARDQLAVRSREFVEAVAMASGAMTA